MKSKTSSIIKGIKKQFIEVLVFQKKATAVIHGCCSSSCSGASSKVECPEIQSFRIFIKVPMDPWLMLAK